MKSYSAYLVKNTDEAAVRRTFRRVESWENSSWLVCNLIEDDEPPEEDVLSGDTSLACAHSVELGEVVFVYGDISIEGFVYEHARDGELLRKLVYFLGPDDVWAPTWQCVVGEPESWEQALFNDTTLERVLGNEQTQHRDEGRADEFADREAELRALWASGRLVAGQSYPPGDGTVAWLVERSYGIDRGW